MSKPAAKLQFFKFNDDGLSEEISEVQFHRYHAVQGLQLGQSEKHFVLSSPGDKHKKNGSVVIAYDFDQNPVGAYYLELNADGNPTALMDGEKIREIGGYLVQIIPYLVELFLMLTSMFNKANRVRYKMIKELRKNTKG